MISRVIIVALCILKSLCKKYELLPYYSVLCQNNSQRIQKDYEFTINQQINLNTNANLLDVQSIIESNNDNDTRLQSHMPWSQIDNDNYRYYICRTLVKPMGRPLDVHSEHGDYSFWNVRIRIDRIPGVNSCNDYLLLQFRHRENLVTRLDGFSVRSINLTCRDALPVIILSEQRKIYITYFSSDTSSPGYVINITSFIYFRGDFSLEYQQQLCGQQFGFWCLNSSVCIFREMKCDGLDSCFDGGSDEVHCFNKGNYTIQTPRDRRNKSSSGFIDYLPWLALGILPLILLLALICICNQHRSEVYFDEEEDNLDVEKSHDDNGDDMWSSVDDLDKTNDDMLGVECVGPSGTSFDQWEGKDESIGLVALTHKETTVVDVSASRALPFIGRDHGDSDRGTKVRPDHDRASPPALVTVNGDQPPSRDDRAEDSSGAPNVMCLSQMTDDDYEDHLEDVGSLLRKVDKSKIPEEVRNAASRSSPPGPDHEVDYRSDYILV